MSNGTRNEVGDLIVSSDLRISQSKKGSIFEAKLLYFSSHHFSVYGSPLPAGTMNKTDIT